MTSTSWSSVPVSRGWRPPASLPRPGAVVRSWKPGTGLVVESGPQRPGRTSRSTSVHTWIHGSDGNPVYDEAVRLGLATTVLDVGSSGRLAPPVLYSAGGFRIDEDPIEQRVAAVIRQLERVADTGGSGSIAMRAGLDELPPRLRDLARQPEVAASLADYAGDSGRPPRIWR